MHRKVVPDIVDQQKIELLPASTTVRDAARNMAERHIGAVLVGKGRRLEGIFTERDVLTRVVARGLDPDSTTLDKVMTPNPETLSVRSAVAYALNKMSVGGFRHIPVVDDEQRPAFVVSVRDVVEFLVQYFPREVLNLPPEEGVKRQQAREGA